MYSGTVNRSSTVGGKSFPFAKQVSASKISGVELTFSPAKNGVLTSKTDADTGSLTMSGGHGITTGVRLDVYWVGGSRRGMTVGTVSTNVVPIDGGAGDALPAAATVITAMVPVSEDIVVSGDDVTLLAEYGSAKGAIVLTDASNALILGKAVGGANGAEQSYVWATGDGTNPVASSSIAKVFMSHSDSTAAAEMRLSLLHD